MSSTAELLAAWKNSFSNLREAQHNLLDAVQRMDKAGIDLHGAEVTLHAEICDRALSEVERAIGRAAGVHDAA